MQDTIDARGSVVLISGEAGVGKTRLVAELRDRIEPLGVDVVTARCFAYTRSALAPLQDAVRDLHARSPDVSIDGAGGEPADTARGQFHALSQTLRAFGRIRPAIVILEDVHWSDVATIEFVQAFAAAAEDSRVLLVLTFRENEDGTGLLHAAIARLGMSASIWKLALEPFSDEELLDVVNFSIDPDRALPSSAIRQILELAEGNPLFAEELLKDVLDRGERRQRAELPGTIRALALARAADIPAEDRMILRHAAAIGRSFDVAFVARVSAVPMTAVVDALIRAKERQLIVDDGSVAGRCAFRHALMCESLYAEMIAVERQRLHAAILTALEESPDFDEKQVELAHHAWAAAVSPKAIAYNTRAGDEAASAFAYADASRFYERVVAFVPEGGQHHADICEKLALSLKYAGYPRKAKLAFERVAAYALASGETRRYADLCLDVGQQAYNAGDADSLDWRIAALEAMRPTSQDPLYHEALVDVAKGHSLRGDVDGADEYFAEAGRLLPRATSTSRVDFFMYRGLNYAMHGMAAEALSSCREAIGAVNGETRPPTVIMAYSHLGICASVLGDVATGIEAYTRSAELARTWSIPFMEAAELIALARVSLLANDLDAARASLQRAFRLAADFDRAWLHFRATEVSILLGLALGDDDLIESRVRSDEVERAFASGESIHIAAVSTAFAELHKARGEHEAAAQLLHRALGRVTSCGLTPWLPIAIARYGRVDDAPPARRLLARWARPECNPAATAYLALFDAYAQPSGSVRRGELAAVARREFARMGVGWFELRAAELTDPPARGVSVAAADAHGFGDLTPREVEIALEVSTGRSNRTIAATLGIRPRTVETHLTSIFSKLDLVSRAELAAYVVRRQLAATTAGSARRSAL